MTGMWFTSDGPGPLVDLPCTVHRCAHQFESECGPRCRTTRGPAYRSPHSTCIEVTSHGDLAAGRRSWLCGENCPTAPGSTSPVWSRTLSACRPAVRADRAGPYARARGIERWEWYTECVIHDSKIAAAGGTWAEALILAAEHQREWALS